ncbi:glycoside hydrolase family 2 protein [Flavobacterium sp. FlaQc-47]|uniref:glycoside hydrolase family 2 protein n=1 Tax=Flavobacterium sp. FlaQc-47 TaxID=3374180 RepID=UPI0037570E7D
MKDFKKCFFIILLLMMTVSYGQQKSSITFNETFAPSESFVKAAEKPYRDDICLNGSWEFQPIKLAPSFKESIDPCPDLPRADNNKWSKTAVRIPSPWNVNSFADKKSEGGDFRTYPSYPKDWEDIKMGWLRKKFTVPESFKGKRIMLHFEALAGDAEFILNGKAVGSHFGIFLPFDIDITDAVQFSKENELLIGVRKPSLFDQRSDFGRRTYQAGSFWGQHIVGIWQDVYVVSKPLVSIEDVFVQPLVDQKKLEVEVTLVNKSQKSVSLNLESGAFKWLLKKDGMGMPLPGSDTEKKASIIFPAATVKLKAQETLKIKLVAAVNGELSEWSPEQPDLYGLTINAKSKDITIDSKYTRFGWRQTALRNGKFYLNGKAVVMKGDSWHFMGIPQMTRRYAWAWYKAIGDANLNAVRLHAQPYPSFYLDMADEMGILVLDETAVWASDGGPKLNSDAYWKDSETHLRELILRDRNHPAVIGWSVSNEVMPIVRGVMRNPPGMKEKLVSYYEIWASICRENDVTRPWISADGEDDGEGKLPVYLVHYGGLDAMTRGEKSTKPWGVGEAGNAYYGTPEQVSESNGVRAYESFQGRMEGVAASSYKSLVAQRERKASYQSVFNLVWYGLKPLALGKKNLSVAPSLEEGIYFTQFQEGKPGVQPERLGPYSTTLNPGYDTSLPLYQTWPLFDAIRDASAQTPLATKWVYASPTSKADKIVKSVTSLKVVAGSGSVLNSELNRIGVPTGRMDKEAIPAILFIDGVVPPDQSLKETISKVLQKGGKVVVWGVGSQKLTELNKLLPAPIELTNRSASSLLPATDHEVISGLSAADMYFSELIPADIVKNGLSGALVKESQVLLKMNDTDWLKWNKQPEYAKTAMILRSELESKPEGAVMICKNIDKGQLIVTTLPGSPRLAKGEKMVREILSNMGIPLETSANAGKPMSKTGDLVKVLAAGSFPVNSIDEAAKLNVVKPSEVDKIKADIPVNGKPWRIVSVENNLFDFTKVDFDGPKENTGAYLSFWISSPRSLQDLLIEPNIPVVNFEAAGDQAIQVWLNGKLVIEKTNTGSGDNIKAVAEALKLQQGWNHFLIKVVRGKGKWQFHGRFTSSQPAFLSELGSALEKP